MREIIFSVFSVGHLRQLRKLVITHRVRKLKEKVKCGLKFIVKKKLYNTASFLCVWDSAFIVACTTKIHIIS